MNVGVIMYQTSQSKGQELVAQRMTAELNRQGHQAFLITSRFHDSRPVIAKLDLRRSGGAVIRDNDVLGIPVVRVGSSLAEWPPRRVNFDNFVATLDRVVGELDLEVLITHSTLWNGPELVARFVAWKRKMSREAGNRDPPLFCHMSHYQPPVAGRYSFRERTYREVWNEHSLALVVKEADLLLVTTPAAGRAMIDLGAKSGQLFLFPGGIMIPAERTAKEIYQFREERRIPEARLISYLGTMEERKNPLAILAVAERFRQRSDLHFVLAGKLEGGYGYRIKKISQRLGNVSLLGEVSEGEKSSLIRSSYLNLTMTRLEALGLAQIEFMSAGVPVITSGVGGQAWIVKDGVTGVVLKGPEDVDGAAEAILRLLENEDKRNQLGMNAKRFASDLSMEHLTERLADRLQAIRSQKRDEGAAAQRSPG